MIEGRRLRCTSSRSASDIVALSWYAVCRRFRGGVVVAKSYVRCFGGAGLPARTTRRDLRLMTSSEIRRADLGNADAPLRTLFLLLRQHYHLKHHLKICASLCRRAKRKGSWSSSHLSEHQTGVVPARLGVRIRLPSIARYGCKPTALGDAVAPLKLPGKAISTSAVCFEHIVREGITLPSPTTRCWASKRMSYGTVMRGTCLGASIHCPDASFVRG
jgi:hypothetical protein